ncbi:MAG TPA: RraA family protein [Casimicrobiaceae bacterium]|nr:RraA family protein [Casimicrobiaceae bacterium]
MRPELEFLSARLRRLSSTVVSDVLDRAGYSQQSLSSAIRPLGPGMKFAGPAVCFSGVTVYGDASGVKTLSPFEIDRGADEGVAIVIATNGHAISAVIGGLMSLALRTRGCAGVVVDGGARDVGEIVELGLPVFCRYATPLISAGRWALTTANTQIRVAGQASPMVEVAPGDLVIGDSDGVIVIPQAIAADIVSWAETVAEIEESIAARLRVGETREAAFAAHPRFAHIRRLRE